jgi:hypothetical protein
LNVIRRDAEVSTVSAAAAAATWVYHVVSRRLIGLIATIKDTRCPLLTPLSSISFEAILFRFGALLLDNDRDFLRKAR